MPDFVDPDVPYSGRDRRKGTKIYRQRYVNSYERGPSIGKRIITEDTDSAIDSILDRAGNPLPNTKGTLFPLLEDDSFGLENFGVFYSTNKRNRWAIKDIARQRIAEVQDPSKNLRVSYIMSVQNGQRRRGRVWHHRAFSSWCYEFREYHTVNADGDEVHKSVRDSIYETFTREPNPPKRKKRHSELNATPQVSGDEAQPRSKSRHKVQLWERKAHVIFEEYTEQLSKRLVNMNEHLKRYRGYDYENSGFLSRRKLLKKEAREQLAEADFLVDHFENSKNSLRTAIATTKMQSNEKVAVEDYSKPLSEYLTSKRKEKRKKQVQHRPEAEYFAWFTQTDRSSTSKGVVESDDNANGTTSSPSSGKPLESFPISLPSQRTFELFVEERLGHAEPIDGLWPLTYSVEVTASLLENLTDYVPQDFSGVGLLQKVAWKSGAELYARCILNPEPFSRPGAERERSVQDRWSFLAENYADDHFAHTESLLVSDAEIAWFPPTSNAKKPQRSEDGELPTSSSTCNICWSVDAYCTGLNCRHFFCDQCWVRHIAGSIHYGRIPINCPEYDCAEFLTPQQMLALAPQALCERYRILLHNRLLSDPNCYRCNNCKAVVRIKSRETGYLLARCQCGYCTCLSCFQHLHVPMGCSQAALYRRALNNETYWTVNDVTTVEVKRCPACKEYCQRSQGCNTMSCRCGEVFCFICCQSFKSHDNGECKSVVMQVELIDVPRSPGLLPRRIFDICLRLHRQSSAPALRNLYLMVSKLHLDVFDKRRILTTVSKASRLLEMCFIHQHYLKSEFRRLSRRKLPSQGVGLRIGLLGQRQGILRFRISYLKGLIENVEAKPQKLMEACSNAEAAIAGIMRFAY